MRRERVATQSEVIRAIVLEGKFSRCCGGAHHPLAGQLGHRGRDWSTALTVVMTKDA